MEELGGLDEELGGLEEDEPDQDVTPAEDKGRVTLDKIDDAEFAAAMAAAGKGGAVETESNPEIDQTYFHAHFWGVVRVRQLSRHKEFEGIIPGNHTVSDFDHLCSPLLETLL